MKVKYLGEVDTPALIKGKIYNVISIEKGWFRIMTELDEDYLFPQRLFAVIEPENLRKTRDNILEDDSAW